MVFFVVCWVMNDNEGYVNQFLNSTFITVSFNIFFMVSFFLIELDES